jgi:hypothetical protein
MEGLSGVNVLTFLGCDDVSSGECSEQVRRNHHRSKRRQTIAKYTVSHQKTLENLTTAQFINKQRTNISFSHNFNK